MSNHPYSSLPDYRRWSRGVRDLAGDQVDPVITGKFKLSPHDKIVTAGSCFAQHISRCLSAAGFNFLITERPHPYIDPAVSAAYGYGTFSARYGNIYSSRQLLQLFQRTIGALKPAEHAWEREGRFFDPFRTGVQPGGFATRRELEIDRAQHLSAVREAFTKMDVFVFTLGLTECWASKQDGAVFASCPGVIAGHFNDQHHHFLNLDVEEVAEDLLSFIQQVRAFNPSFKMVLTVSPVPLAATALDEHVLTASSYSKAVLRVAAAMVERSEPESVAYFPSYEIITGPHARGAYYADDLRNVVEAGIDHVMRAFFKHFTDSPEPIGLNEEPTPRPLVDLKQLVDVQCEEAMLDLDTSISPRGSSSDPPPG